MTSSPINSLCNPRNNPELPLRRDYRPAFDVLADALTRCHQDRVNGTLRVVGNAGGLFHLRDGVVIAVDSPGSPGADTLLLSSGRISAEDWTAALVESVGTRSIRAALVARGAIGSAEVEVVALAALQDAAFAVAAGDIERCVVTGDSAELTLLAMDEGIGPDLLLSETARRLDVIASLPFPVSPYRDRVVVASEEVSVSTAERREIVAHATGRRNARDIAFAVGRGVYPVVVEISRMLSEELLEIASPATSFSFSHGDLTSLRPRAEVTEVERPV